MPASSPCVQLCAIDAGTGLCRGCGRSLVEIAAWSTLTEGERLAIMAGLDERRRAGFQQEPHPVEAEGA